MDNVTSERDGEHLAFHFNTPPDSIHAIPHKRIHEVYRPFTATVRRFEPGGGAAAGRIFLLFTCASHSAEECTRLTITRRNDKPENPDTGKDEIIHDTLVEQDRTITENRRPEELSLDLTEVLHVKGAGYARPRIP